jgi:aspartyl-tRNA(Asn)/glutamyl-tRNA(Gln) amidotransferase subunit A
MTDLLALSISDVSRMIANREVSPVELTRASLERIDQQNPSLGAFTTTLPDMAVQAAREAEREIAAGRYRGSLHGVPIGVKDLLAIAGVPLTAGSPILGGYRAEEDATVVAKLKQSGAIVVGMTGLDEFAFTTTGTQTKNPLDQSRSPGGSSGGSAAAVAAKMCFGAIGTDTGGSIRIPAACCGVVGLKPTYGRVSKVGVIPLAWSLDHVGPIGRTAADTAAILQVIAGHDPQDRSTAAVRVDAYQPQDLDRIGIRVGVPDDAYFDTVEEHVLATFRRGLDVLKSLGADIQTIGLPHPDKVLDFHYITVMVEAATYHRRRFPRREREYSEGIREALNIGSQVSACDYLDAQRARSRVQEEVSRVFRSVDIIAMPTLATLPPKVGEREITLANGRREDATAAMVRFTCTYDHTGHPAISVPYSFSDPPLAGLQLIAPHFQERRLIQVAHSYERALRRREEDARSPTVANG